MAKKRRRGNNRKSETGGELLKEENAPLARGTDFVDEYVFKFLKLLGIRIPRTLFTDGGFRCIRCGFRTKKLGTSGRNSMRAHGKRHLREVRAGRHLRRLVWSGLLLGVMTLVYVLYMSFGARVVESWAYELTWSDLMGPVLVGTSITTSAAAVTTANLYRSRYKKHWRIAFYTTIVPAFAILLAHMAVVTGIVHSEVAWPWLLGGILPIGALTLTRKEVGLTALDISRRAIKPRKYIRMWRSKTADGDSLLVDIYLEITMMIRTGQLQTQNLEDWQRQALATLEIRGFTFQESSDS